MAISQYALLRLTFGTFDAGCIGRNSERARARAAPLGQHRAQLSLAGWMEMDMKNSIPKAVLLVLFAITARTGLAHHSFAMFDQDKVITLQGTVREFQWTNPHSWIQVMVPGDGGKVTEWSVEMGGPGGLARKGWKPRTLKQGDKVTIVIHPLRDGGPGGSFVSVILPSGVTMGGDQFRVAK